MHKEEETPNKKEETNNKADNSRQSEIEVLKGKSINLFSCSILTGKSKNKEHPKI